MNIEYKGHSITLNERNGKFEVVIDGLYKRFASLQSAKNAVDKAVVITFTPVKVLIVDSKGYAPSKSFVKEVLLTGYREEKSYRGRLSRYFTTNRTGEGWKTRISVDSEIFALKDRAKLEANLKEVNEQEVIQYRAEAQVRKLDQKREAMRINLDPRPEARY